MNETTRRKLEMGKRVLDFCRENPTTDPGWLALVARLEQLMARADELQRQVELEEQEN